MVEINSTRTDPRERLVQVGNELLDVLYQLDSSDQIVKPMLAAKDDKDALSEMMKADGAIQAIVTGMTLGLKRESLTREYVMLRQTIEALTEPRSDGLS